MNGSMASASRFAEVRRLAGALLGAPGASSPWDDLLRAVEALPPDVPLPSWALLCCRAKNAARYGRMGLAGPALWELRQLLRLAERLEPADPEPEPAVAPAGRASEFGAMARLMDLSP